MDVAITISVGFGVISNMDRGDFTPPLSWPLRPVMDRSRSPAYAALTLVGCDSYPPTSHPRRLRCSCALLSSARETAERATWGHLPRVDT